MTCFLRGAEPCIKYAYFAYYYAACAYYSADVACYYADYACYYSESGKVGNDCSEGETPEVSDAQASSKWAPVGILAWLPGAH